MTPWLSKTVTSEAEAFGTSERQEACSASNQIGGQFNTEPGEFSKRIIDKLASIGADIIIGNHPHTVQKVEQGSDATVAYSLGGFCMSTSGEYLVHECLPEYSLALHIDIDEHDLTRKVSLIL